jgi:hypothetical protein
MNKIILIVLYVLLVGSSGYNLYSFKPNVGMGIKLSKGISENLQNYIVISNISDENFDGLDVIVNEEYYLHIYKIEKKSDYNAFSTEFLKINNKPLYSSRIMLKNKTTTIKRLEEANDIFGKKVDVFILKKGETYNQKL